MPLFILNQKDSFEGRGFYFDEARPFQTSSKLMVIFQRWPDVVRELCQNKIPVHGRLGVANLHPTVGILLNGKSIKVS